MFYDCQLRDVKLRQIVTEKEKLKTTLLTDRRVETISVSLLKGI